MKVQFILYLNRPLSYMCGRILDLLDRYPWTVPKKFQVARVDGDLDRQEFILSLCRDPVGWAEIKTRNGQILLSWKHEPDARSQRVSGTLVISSKQVDLFKEFLAEMSLAIEAIYGHCDLERNMFIQDGDRIFHQTGVFLRPDWFNYFAPIFRPELPVTTEVQKVTYSVESLENGALLVLMRKSPDEPRDIEKEGDFSAIWPVFTRYNKAAHFRTGIQIDYSAVRSFAHLPVEEKGPVDYSRIESPKKFIASVSVLVEELNAWLRNKGIFLPESEYELLKILVKEEGNIKKAGLFPAAVAAYGEALRERVDGIWDVRDFDGEEEPVLVERGDRDKIYRVLEEMSGDMDQVDQNGDQLEMADLMDRIANSAASFIEAAPREAIRFYQWLRKEEIGPPATEEEFLSILHENFDLLRGEDSLLAALAAYGEFIIKTTGGKWAISHGEREGIPHIATENLVSRYVIQEALEAMLQ